MKTLVICNDPPYGTERSWNGLRLAGALAKREGVDVRAFLLGDAVGCAVSGQGTGSVSRRTVPADQSMCGLGRSTLRVGGNTL